MPEDTTNGTTPQPSTSAARSRLLDTAIRLFYREGIHSVGVDRIIADAGVTRTTFYRYFPGKEDLVEAYLDAEDEIIRGYFADGIAEETDARALLGIVIDGIADDIARYHTRGCPFINAAAEYPDADSRVRAVVARHRSWFRGALHDLLTAAGAADPDAAAGALVLLRDAALVGGYLDGVDTVTPPFRASARRLAGLD